MNNFKDKKEFGVYIKYESAYLAFYAMIYRHIIIGNRFFVDNNYFKTLKEYLHLSLENQGPLICRKINCNEFFYRARIIDNTKLEEKDQVEFEPINDTERKLAQGIKPSIKQESAGVYYGFNEKNSLAPPAEKAPNGRLNPQYIQMLYLSCSPYTALVESRPIIGAYVSIAKVVFKKPLRILKIPSDVKFSGTDDGIFLFNLNKLFSTPSSGDMKDYLFTQYFAEYVESSHMFDGIEFQSSLDKNGSNIVIFHQKNCKAISSKAFKVDSIGYRATCLAPYDGSVLSPHD